MLTNKRVVDLYGNFKVKLCNYVNSIVKNMDTSEDLVHDAFVKLIEYSQKYDIKDNNLKSFLYKICRNISINYLKRKNHFEFIPIEVVDQNLYFNSICCKSEPNKIELKLEPILNHLSVRHYIIFQLSIYLNNNQIAKEIGISERTVRRKLKESKNYIKTNSSLKKIICG